MALQSKHPQSETANDPDGAGRKAEEPPIVVGSREQLLHLLAEASEIEHTIMCSYLYAAFSLKTGSEEFSPRQRGLVDQWSKSIMSVAIDEMTHLVLVSNIAIAVGGQAHLTRPNFPVSPGYFPSGVVAKLTPFSLETLDHFIHLERPMGFDPADPEMFRPERDYQREEAYHGLMPSVQDYQTVGRLYEAVRVNLRENALRLGEDGLFIGSIGNQISASALQMEGIQAVTSLESALAAIDTIVEQGEGSPSDRDNSHYNRFVTIRDEYARELENSPGFAPNWPVAINPVMRRPPEPEDKVFIDTQPAAQTLDLSNAVYAMLLKLLTSAFMGSDQARYLNAAIGLMHALKRTSTVLSSLPASQSMPDVNAGMTFTMLRSISMQGDTELRNCVLSEQLRALAEGASIVGRSIELSDLPAELRKLAEQFGLAARPASVTSL